MPEKPVDSKPPEGGAESRGWGATFEQRPEVGLPEVETRASDLFEAGTLPPIEIPKPPLAGPGIEGGGGQKRRAAIEAARQLFHREITPDDLSDEVPPAELERRVIRALEDHMEGH